MKKRKKRKKNKAGDFLCEQIIKMAFFVCSLEVVPFQCLLPAIFFFFLLILKGSR